MSGTDHQRQFSALLMPLARAYRRYVDRALVSTGQSHATALAAMLLGRMGDGVRQGALAEQLGVEAPSVVPLVDAMEREGLVERRVDPTDKRARTLHLSAAGRQLANDAEIVTARVRAELFAGIADADVAAAMRVMARLGDAIAAAQEPAA